MRILLAMGLLSGLLHALTSAAGTAPSIEENKEPVVQQSKQLWAQSCLYAKAPELVVEKWLTDEPDIAGKFLLVEFWSTWCSSCRAAQPLLNSLHEEFGEDLIIIGISDEPEEIVRSYMTEKDVGYAMAIDPQTRMKDRLGVWGIPHAIIVEPGGYIIWEGYPLLEGHELTRATIAKIIEISK